MPVSKMQAEVKTWDIVPKDRTSGFGHTKNDVRLTARFQECERWWECIREAIYTSISRFKQLQ